MQTEEDFLIEVGTYLGLVEQVGEGRVYVYQLLAPHNQFFTLIVDNETAMQHYDNDRL